MAVMSSFKQQCPSCEAMISIKETMIGKKVECTKCKDKFIAVRPDDDDADADDNGSAKKDTKLGAKKNTAVKSGPPKTPAAAGKRPKLDVDDDDAKSSTGKPSANGKAKPPKSSKADPDEDEEEDEKPKKKKKEASSNKLIIGLALAVVGVLLLAGSAYFVMRDRNPKGQANNGPVQPGPPDGGNPDDNKPPPPVRPKDPGPAPDPVASSLTDAERAKLSNMLPNDSEHVFHGYMENMFGVNGPLREPVFTPGPLDDADLKKRLGFSLLAIDDFYLCEKYTAPAWRYTVIHFKDVINEKMLKNALNMTAISVDGQTCYKSLGSHAWFDTLAQFSVGIPNYLRYFDERGRNKPSYIRVHNPQTLIIVSADEKPAMTLLRANGKFDMRQPKQAPPVNPNPPGSMIGGNPPTGMMGGAGMTGMDGGMPPANNMRGGTAPMPMPVMPPGSPMPMPISPSVPPGRPMPGGGTSGQSTYDPNTGEHFTAFQGGFVPPQVIQPMPGGPRPMPGGDPQPVNMQGGTPGAMMGQMTGGAGMMGQTGMTGGNPMSPPPQPANPRDEMYLTVKVGLKAALDKVEQKAADAKEKILFSSATDMDANRIDLPDVRNAVVRMPRQFWDVTLLLYERKPFIRTLGVALIQKETLKYQFRNEIICGDDIAAKEFENDLRDRISPQVVKFIYAVSKHEVTLPNATKKADPDAPPNPVPPEGGAAQPEEKKPQDINSSQITVEQEYASVRFILDLMLDNPALMQVQGLAALTAGTLRVEMEAAASPSLRHGLAAAGKVLGEKGTSDRQVPEGTWPPGAFRRESDKRDIELRIDREPGRRISWMAALLPHMGHQNLYNRLNFRQSWRDPGNWSAGNKLVPQFLDPRYPDYARFVSVTDIPLDFAATHYVGIAGVGLDAASYRAGDPATAHKRGILSYEGSASMDNVRQGRGLANTMLMIQIPHDGITGVSPWIAGGGATLRGVPEKNSIAPFVLTTDRDKKTINHDGKRGTFVLMADGSVRFVDQNVKDEVFKAMATIGGPAPEDFNLDKNEHTPLLPPPDPKDKEPAKKPVVQPPVKGDEDKKPAGGANIDQIKAALQGTWIAKSAKIDGKDAPAEFLKILQTTFKGDTITTLDGKGNPEESPYTIDVTKTPFQLEFKAPSETGPTLCVFELAGGELRVCARGPEFPGGRPTSFSSTLGSGLALIVFTKQ